MDKQSILKPNATMLEKAIEGAMRASDIDLAPIGKLMNPQTCPAHLLGWLAWAFSVDIWDENWPETIKRDLIATSIATHRIKGTVGAVKAALKSAGYGDAEIVEGVYTTVGAAWRVGDRQTAVGGPKHWAEYWVILKDKIAPKFLKNIILILNKTAPARSHITRVIIENANQGVGSAWRVGDDKVLVGATHKIGDLLNA